MESNHSVTRKMAIPATILSLLLSGCGFHVDKGNSNRELLQLGAGQIDFRIVSQAVFQTRCVTCHGTSGGVNMQSYPSVKQNIDRIRMVLENRRMPKSGPLPEEESRLVLQWIQDGAPEKVEGARAEVAVGAPLPPLEPTFRSLKARLFGLKCVGCHSPNSHSEAEKYPLVSYDDIVHSPENLVNPMKPEKSLIVKALRGQIEDRQMPPPDSGVTPPTQEEIQTLIDWIANGMKE